MRLPTFRLRATLLSVLAVALAGPISVGCSGGSGGSSAAASTAAGSTAPGTTPITPAAPAPGSWYKGDLHSHSATHSEDARRQLGDPIATTVRVAERAGLDFLAGTDHRTNAVITDPDFSSQTLVCLPGMEWGGEMHAGAIGLTQPIQVSTTKSGADLAPEVDGVIASVHQQGGIFVLNHPIEAGNKLWVVDAQEPDALEVWNSMWSLRDFQPRTQQDLDAKMTGMGLTQAGVAPNPHLVDGIADQRGGCQQQVVTMWESYLNAGRRVAAVGGGDRHMLLPQGYPTTHVYAAARTRDGILDGIRQCRTYVSRTPQGPLVDFRADANGDGIYEALIGDEVVAGQPATFRILIEGAPGGRVDVIKRGVVIRTEAITSAAHMLTLTDLPAAGDWYRVDVFEAIDPAVDSRAGTILRLAQATGKEWAPLAALMTQLPKSAFDTSWGTLLPTLLIPDELSKLANASLKDPGYSRGAITSPIFTR